MRQPMLLSAQNLHYTYTTHQQPQPLLRGIHLSIQAGEWHCILGRSGAGKTTLLNCLSGLDPHYEGCIEFQNQNLRSLKASQLNRIRATQLGFIYQSHHLILQLSAIENVALAVMIAGSSAQVAHQKAQVQLSLLGLSSVQDQPAHTLSGGERQRVAIARALVNQPALIIADEPVGQLDETTAQQTIRILHEACQTHKTACLIVTHDPVCIMPQAQVHQLTEGRLHLHQQQNG
ncbi:MAG: lipoprotein-releasing system ATP-binding protein LolD [Legionellales bacterium]|nr:lipoprotein-releasing system ATP-binding protein LolD [Legionellales bacterium]